MLNQIEQIELERLNIQIEIDSSKNHEERNKLGQFATPPQLALDILAFAKQLMKPHERVRFLDPAIGTGSFYSALRQTFDRKCVDVSVGVEIDKNFAKVASELWSNSGLKMIAGDFTVQNCKSKFNLIISNPPYVRHHHLSADDKNRMRRQITEEFDINVSGLMGLYGYFLLLSHQWLSDDGIAGWLIPSEFMDVNYGSEIKRYLLRHVELLQIHRFDPQTVQFDDALVSSAVVWFRKRKPTNDHRVKFTFGGTLCNPKMERQIPARDLSVDAKWTRYPESNILATNKEQIRLGDLLTIRRGLATGDNHFFIMPKSKIKELGLSLECFKPVLPPPRLLKQCEIFADDDGLPIFEDPSFLLDSSLSLCEIKKRFPALADYISQGEAADVSKGYLCAHREPWYSQEKRESAPLLCTYMGRGTAKSNNPFRFILNHSKAIATNVYLMLYPKPEIQSKLRYDPTLLFQIWTALSQIDAAVLCGEGRVYGGGLYKLEPKELANVPIEVPAELVKNSNCLF